jgi:hypothetical protein
LLNEVRYVDAEEYAWHRFKFFQIRFAVLLSKNGCSLFQPAVAGIAMVRVAARRLYLRECSLYAFSGYKHISQDEDHPAISTCSRRAVTVQ